MYYEHTEEFKCIYCGAKHFIHKDHNDFCCGNCSKVNKDIRNKSKKVDNNEAKSTSEKSSS